VTTEIPTRRFTGFDVPRNEIRGGPSIRKRERYDVSHR
jgi:hypothetical protein